MQETNPKKVIKVCSIKKIICKDFKTLKYHAYKTWLTVVKFFKTLKTVYAYDANQNKKV
jgi:hypothetical protein